MYGKEGGVYTGQPLGDPETVEVFSDNANDTAAGTGARTVRITGLKSTSSTSEESEDLTLNGTSAVTSVNTWYRIYRIRVLTAGSGGENAGILTARHTTTTANVFASMPVGFNQSVIAAFSVPSGCTLLIKRVRVSIARASGAAGSATVSLRVRPPGGVFNAIRVFEIQTGGQVEFSLVGGDVVESGSDIKFRVEDVSDNNTIVEAAFEYVIID